jgi:hypothetical protein
MLLPQSEGYMKRRMTSLFLLFTMGAAFAQAEDNRRSTAPRSWTDRVVDGLARRIEPDLAGRAERIAQYVEFFHSEIGNDQRLFAFNVSAARNASGLVELEGHIEFSETRDALIKYLGALGFEVEDRLMALPADELGEKIFGLVKVAHTYGYDSPDGRRGIETDCLLGEPLYLLREVNGRLLAHSGEGYLAYVSDADVLRVDGADFARYMDGPSVRVFSDQQLPSGLTIPAGARLKWIRAIDDKVSALLPTGEVVDLPAAACQVFHEPTSALDAIINNAKKLLGTPYQWGGRTTDGVDCSGLVQIGYVTVGLNLPRDSYQQFYVGRLVATRWHTAGLRRGDTLYFLGDDGKIRHTGLYLGDDRYLHATSPVVRINSFNPDHDDYEPRRHRSFAFAKRLLD